MRKAHDAIGDAQGAIQDAQPHRMEIAAAIFLIAVSVAMNARGAWSHAALDWSMSDYAQREPSIFDWRYPPFMAGLIPPPAYPHNPPPPRPPNPTPPPPPPPPTPPHPP